MKVTVDESHHSAETCDHSSHKREIKKKILTLSQQSIVIISTSAASEMARFDFREVIPNLGCQVHPCDALVGRYSVNRES